MEALEGRVDARKDMADWKFPLVPGPAAGSKATGKVDWGDPVLVGWEWPYVAVNGARAGPRCW